MASKRYRISFEIEVTDPDGSHPLDWIPEAVGEQIRDDEVVTGYLCEEIEDCDLDSEEKLWDNMIGKA